MTERNDFVKPGISKGLRGLLVGSIYGFTLGVLIGWLIL